jgi:branched-subunit amino acid ABC-type transport system permease component
MRKTGFNMEKRIVVLFVVVLLLEFSFGPSIFGEVQRAVQNTSDAAVTAGIRAYDAAVTAQANATAEAVANASPVAYPPHNLSPALDDPLQDNSKGNN